MIYKIGCLVAFLSFTIATSAQDQTTPQPPLFQHELGLNSTFFVKQFLSFNNFDSLATPYLLTYKLRYKAYAFRVGVGGGRNKTVRTEEGFVDSDTDNSYHYNLRLGVEYQQPIGKRWIGYFGMDFVKNLSLDELINDTGFDRVTRRTIVDEIGFGPIVGIQFNIGQRFSIATEARFYYLFRENRTERLFKNLPQLDDEINRFDEEELITSLPSNIFFIYRF